MDNCTTDELWAKIKKARAWALEHFNTDHCEDARLFDDDFNIIPPSFFVEFSDVDRMEVSPSLFGRPSTVWIKYRLHFLGDDRLVWVGKHPFSGASFSRLYVE